MIGVIQDRDYWWRVTRNGRVMRRRGKWVNLYVTKAAALSKARAILRAIEGD